MGYSELPTFQISSSPLPNSNLCFFSQFFFSFCFDYNERTFELWTKTKEEAQVWVDCLKFLSEHKSKEQETESSTLATTYFPNFLIGSKQEGRDGTARSKSKGRGHKF